MTVSKLKALLQIQFCNIMFWREEMLYLCLKNKQTNKSLLPKSHDVSSGTEAGKADAVT